MRIAILQPEIPHFRTDFFKGLSDRFEQKLFVYNSLEKSASNGFNISDSHVEYLPNIQKGAFLWYNPFHLLNTKAEVLILMLHFGHLATWILLLTKFIHRRKIILWGQGISVKRYLKEEQKPDLKLRLQMSLADGIWVYMEKEANQWKKLFPQKPIVALNNTISGIENIINSHKNSLADQCLKVRLHAKFGIQQKRIVLYCARFTNKYRRYDILMDVISQCKKEDVAFAIIGDGPLKPDFKQFRNVYDFGAVYNQNLKQEIFEMADLYFQPGWVGLSIVEAMAYGLPVFTFERSENTKQCVEYSYIANGVNGLLFRETEKCIDAINNMSDEEIKALSTSTFDFASRNLTMENMVSRATQLLTEIK